MTLSRLPAFFWNSRICFLGGNSGLPIRLNSTADENIRCRRTGFWANDEGASNYFKALPFLLSSTSNLLHPLSTWIKRRFIGGNTTMIINTWIKKKRRLAAWYLYENVWTLSKSQRLWYVLTYSVQTWQLILYYHYLRTWEVYSASRDADFLWYQILCFLMLGFIISTRIRLSVWVSRHILIHKFIITICYIPSNNSSYIR